MTWGDWSATYSNAVTGPVDANAATATGAAGDSSVQVLAVGAATATGSAGDATAGLIWGNWSATYSNTADDAVGRGDASTATAAATAEGASTSATGTAVDAERAAAVGEAATLAYAELVVDAPAAAAIGAAVSATVDITSAGNSVPAAAATATAVAADATGAASGEAGIGQAVTATASGTARPVTTFLQSIYLPPIVADWDGDGFDVAGTLDDLSPYVERWTITRGASPEVTGGAQPGGALIVLNNPADDRFNPWNTGGSLYGLLTDGVPVWIGANSDGALTGANKRGLFGGRITDITPIPESGAGICPTVEVACEDALGWYQRTPARVADERFRAQGAMRAAILDAVGETRVDLPSEIPTMPVSGWDGSALAALEALNQANGTRHFIRPADNAAGWYDYVARNRQYRLDATVDATIVAVTGDDRIVDSSGFRRSADTVTNQQRVTIEPIRYTSGQVTVWALDVVPVVVTAAADLVHFVEFDDYVAAPSVNVNYTGTAPTVTLEPFGSSARLTVESAGTTTIKRLSIEGSLARRGVPQVVLANDTASQAGMRGIRSGAEITGDFVGVLATATGIAQHVTWRYGTPQMRPTVTVADWFPEMFDLDLFHVISVALPNLSATRLFEIVGLTHVGSRDGIHSTTYILQECKVQADPGWFILDSSLLDGAGILAY